jgi:glycosyltransferase involved in cell wall biosynthesis
MTIDTQAGPLELSVVVPAYNAADALPVLLAALDRQTLRPEAFEVVVADDASTDGTAAVLDAHPRVRSVRLAENRGSYAARNAALAVARGAVIAFTDGDCEPAPDWLEAGLAALAATGADLVGGRIHVPLSERPSTAELLEVGSSFDQRRTIQDHGYAVTANLFVRRAVVEALGGFDGTVVSGGDTQFCLRARAEGFRIAYADAAVVRHPPRSTRRELATKAWRYGVGRAQLPPAGPGVAGPTRVELWRHPGAYIPRRGPLDTDRLREQHDYRLSRAQRLRMRGVDWLFQRLPMLVGNAVASARGSRRG